MINSHQGALPPGPLRREERSSDDAKGSALGTRLRDREVSLPNFNLSSSVAKRLRLPAGNRTLALWKPRMGRVYDFYLVRPTSRGPARSAGGSDVVCDGTAIPPPLTRHLPLHKGGRGPGGGAPWRHPFVICSFSSSRFRLNVGSFASISVTFSQPCMTVV